MEPIKQPLDLDSHLEAVVEVGRILQKRYGFSRESVVDDYDVVIAEMGLSGDPIADRDKLMNADKEVYERSERIKKAAAASPVDRSFREVSLDERGQNVADRMNMGWIQSKARNLSAAVTEGMHTLMAGSIETAALTPRKKDFFTEGHEAMTAKAEEIRAERDFKSVEAAEFYLKPREHETLSGKVVAAAPSVGAAMIHPATIFPLLFEEATSFSEEVTGKKFKDMTESEQQDADLMRLTYMGVGGMFEKFGLGAMTKNIFIGGAKKAVVNTIEAAAVEGTTEGSQQRLLYALAKHIQGADIDVFDSETLLGMAEEFFTSDEFKVGAILGGGVRGGFESSAGIYNKFLSPDTAATRADFDALGDLSTKEVIQTVLDHTDGDTEAAELAARAHNGDEEARKEYIDRNYYSDEELGEYEGSLDPAEREAVLREREREQQAEADINAQEQEREARNKIRIDGANAAMEVIGLTSQEDLDLDVDESRVIDAMTRLNEVADAQGLKGAEKDAWIVTQLTAAAANQGITLEQLQANIGNQRIIGESTRVMMDNAIKYRIQLNAGFNVTTVLEEATHTEFKRLVDTVGQEAALEQALQWKAQVETEAGQKTHGDTFEEVDEWLAHQGIAWGLRNYNDEAKMKTIPQAIREWIENFIHTLKAVLADGKLLSKLDAEGKLDPEMKKFLQRSTGEDTTTEQGEDYGRSGDQQGRNGSGSSSSGIYSPLEGAPTIRGVKGGIPKLIDASRSYALKVGIPHRKQGEYVKIDIERSTRIAQAYEEMSHDPQNPEVKEAYENLIKQTIAQYETLLEHGYEFWFLDPSSDPYEGKPWLAMADLRNNNSMGVFPTESGFGSGATDLDVSDNPLMMDTGFEWGYGSPDGKKQRVLANDLFRAVHDAFGHGLEGAGFRARGEENAWQAHSRLFTGSALAALTSETRGQNSWLNFGKYGEQNQTASVEDTIFADQKTGLMPSWTWTEGVSPDAEISEGQPSFQIAANQQDSAFYSQLERTLSAKLQGKAASVQQVKGLLSPKHGVKPDEVKWSGIEQWLEDNADAKGKVSTADLMDYVRDAGRVKFEEVTRGISGDIISEDERISKAIEEHAEEWGYEWEFNGNVGILYDGDGEVRQEGRPWEVARNEGVEWEAGDTEDLGETQYSSYVLPNGENYREVVLTMPTRIEIPEGYSVTEQGDKWMALSPSGSPAWLETKQEAILWAVSHAEGLSDTPSNNYTSSHFTDIPNYVAHMRLNEREDSEGNEGLFIEEIQSDRHQAGREKGYKEDLIQENFRSFGEREGMSREEIDSAWEEKNDNAQFREWRARQRAAVANASKIPDAPFRKDWNLQMFKRALRDAVASGKDWIGWTVGDTQADRYDLSQQVKGITVYKSRGGYKVEARDHSDEMVVDKRAENDQELAAMIGKDLARDMIEEMERDDYPQATREGDDLKVGGEGMKGFYDKMLPSAVNKYVKKWGAKVERGSVAVDRDFKQSDEDLLAELEGRSADEVRTDQKTTPIHRVAITDAMRESVQMGQPSFQIAGVSSESSEHDGDRVGTAKLGTKAKSLPTPKTSNINTSIVSEELLKKQMGSIDVENYGHLPEEILNESDPQIKKDKLVEWFKRNLLELHDRFPSELRDRATHWYDGARVIAEDFADRAKITPSQSAGVLAVLSPQKDWFMNVAQAEQVISIWTNYRTRTLTAELIGDEIKQIVNAATLLPSQKLKAKEGETPRSKKIRENKNKKMDQEAKDKRAALFEPIIGKSIQELDSDSYLQGWAIRILAQSIFGKDYRVISPEGKPMGLSLTKNGTPQKNGWGSVNEIQKAVKILRGEDVSDLLGEMHKVRNFYNNIVAPNNGFGDATIDTHAVAAAHLMPYGASAAPVLHNFGSGVASAKASGVSGTYHLYLEAYQRAAKDRGILARQMQSITWEAIRQVFPAESRRDKKVIARSKENWSIDGSDKSRAAILSEGISSPAWGIPRGGGESGSIPTGSRPEGDQHGSKRGIRFGNTGQSFQIGEAAPDEARNTELDAVTRKLAAVEKQRLEQIRKLHEQGEDVTAKLQELDEVRKTLPTAIRHRLGGDIQISKRKTRMGRQNELSRRIMRARDLEERHVAQQRKNWLRRTFKRYGTGKGAKLQALAKELTNEVRDIMRVAAYAANSDNAERVIEMMPKPTGMSQEKFEEVARDFTGLLRPSNKNGKQIEAAFFAIQDMLRDGKYQMKKFKEERAAEFDAQVEAAKEGVLRGESAKSDAEIAQAEEERSIGTVLTDWIDSGITGLTAGFENIVRRIDGEKDGKLWNWLYADDVDGVDASVNRTNAYALDAGDYIATGLAEAFPEHKTPKGDPDIKAIIRELAELEKRPKRGDKTGVRFSNKEGEDIKDQPISRAEAMSIWLILRQTGSHNTFFIQHGIEDIKAFQKSLEEYIGVEGMAIIDKLITPFYDDAYYALNEVHERVEGFTVDQVKDYFKFIRESGYTNADVDEAINPFGSFDTTDGKAHVEKGSLVTRSEGAESPFKFISVFDALSQSVAFNANYIGKAGLEKRFRRVQTDPDFKRAIRQTLGKAGEKQFFGAADTVIRGSIKAEKWGARIFEGLRSVGVTSVLGLKPKILFTQLTSIPAGIADMDASLWFEGVQDILQNPKARWEVIKNTPAMRDRLSRSQSQEVLQELRKIGKLNLRNDALSKLETVTRYAMISIKFGDIIGATLSAAPVYFDTHKRVLQETGSEAEAMRVANAAFSRSVNRSQQSPHIHAKSQAYQGNMMFRALMQFRSSPIQYLSEAHMAIREYIVSQKRGDWSAEKKAQVARQSIKAFFVFHILLPQLFFAVNNAFIGLWLDDEDRRIDYWKGMLMTLAFGNLGAIPVWGDAIVATASKAVGLNPFAVGTAPVGLENIAKAPSDAMKVLNPDDLDDFLDGTAQLLDLSGVGVSTFKDGVESAFDMVDEQDPTELLELLGWSEWLFEDE